MPTYLMSCTHCPYEVPFRTEPAAKTEAVRHLLQFPTHGVKVTPSEDAMIRAEERVTA
jgi:hypothetical protein